ncbi:MAG: hypothetical protein OEW56_10430 [Gemmatimonadota bacterium]|nr:hypothetical protein [Gemmatimonadota bacterium]
MNRTLRGWGNYFRWGNSTTEFNAIDSYVACSRNSPRCQTRTAGTGLGQLLRHHLASHPRHLPAHRNGPLPADARHTMNNVGEPDAGEPHVRFDRGPLARGPRGTVPQASKRNAQRLHQPHPGPATSGLPH